MASLKKMPDLFIDPEDLKRFGNRWIENGSKLSRTAPESLLQFGNLF